MPLVLRNRNKERENEQWNDDMGDEDQGMPFIDFDDNPLYSETESEDDDFDNEELIEQIHSQRQREILLQKQGWQRAERKRALLRASRALRAYERAETLSRS